jgi:hypothetical protein
MNLTLFHRPGQTKAYRRQTDYRNSQTGNICYYYEQTGWYDLSIAMRLLGHHRLFQLRKNKYERTSSCLSREISYILHYRENGIIKDTWFKFLHFIKKLMNVGEFAEIKSFHRTLLFKHPEVLKQFLTAAETDFDKALDDAMEHIRNPAFLLEFPIPKLHVEIHENHQYNTSNSRSEFHVHPVIREETPQPTQKGKEEGVFSKKQLLILLDLLAMAKLIEPINFNKPGNFPAIAKLLRALTTRKEEAWMGELRDYHTKSLYDWSSEGQLNELIRILTNLAEKFADAGMNKIARLADQKIRELRKDRF